MKLHTPASPFARKVRIVTRETGLSARTWFADIAQRPSVNATVPA